VNDVAGKTPAQLGYTDADVASKEAAVKRLEAQRQAGTISVSPMATTSLSGYVEFHQKTQAQCLAATVQSILHYRFGDGWVAPSIAGMQTTINSHTGANESSAISYINQKFDSYNFGFHYVVAAKVGRTWFNDDIIIDVGNLAMPSYTEVDVTSYDFAWHQTKPASHATTVSAYDGGAAVTTVSLDDPYTSASVGPGCHVYNGYPGYSSTPNYGCIYAQFDTQRLYNASEHQWY